MTPTMTLAEILTRLPQRRVRWTDDLDDRCAFSWEEGRERWYARWSPNWLGELVIGVVRPFGSICLANDPPGRYIQHLERGHGSLRPSGGEPAFLAAQASARRSMTTMGAGCHWFRPGFVPPDDLDTPYWQL